MREPCRDSLYSRFPIDKLAQHYSIDDSNQGFEDSASGVTVKPIVVFA